MDLYIFSLVYTLVCVCVNRLAQQIWGFGVQVSFSIRVRVKVRVCGHDFECRLLFLDRMALPTKQSSSTVFIVIVNI